MPAPAIASQPAARAADTADRHAAAAMTRRLASGAVPGRFGAGGGARARPQGLPGAPERKRARISTPPGRSASAWRRIASSVSGETCRSTTWAVSS